MTLAQIEQAANRGNIASGSFNIRHVLRFEVIPEFYRKVGDVRWLRKNDTLPVSASDRDYDLPADFRSMIAVYRPVTGSNGEAQELTYIGENPLLVAEAEINTTAGAPTGFYIVRHSTESTWRAIKLDCPPDTTYSLPYVYRSRLAIPNETFDAELDQYIPEDYQSALIWGLRAQIYLDRFSQDDQRYPVAENKFAEICEEAKEGAADLARRNYAVYAD